MPDRSPDPEARFSLRLRLARAALLWERVWPTCWPALAVLGGFFAVGLFDLLPRLPGLLHAALLLGFGAAFVIALAVANRGVAGCGGRAPGRPRAAGSGPRRPPHTTARATPPPPP